MARADLIVPLIDQDAIALFEAPNLTGTPERNLLMAILERAILDYVGNDPEALQNAETWLLEISTSKAPFSFSWLCHQLDLEEFDIREKIRHMPKRGNRRIAPWYFKNAS